MAAAVPFAGIGGFITFALSGITGSVRLRGWALDASADANDATGFASAGWQEVLGGLVRITGSATGYVDTTKTPIALLNVASGQPAAVVSLNLAGTTTVAGTNTYGGSAVITSINVIHQVDQNATVAIRFASSGAWA